MNSALNSLFSLKDSLQETLQKNLPDSLKAKLPALTYSRARSLGFAIEGRLVRLMGKVVPGHQPKLEEVADLKTLMTVRNAIDDMLKKDAAKIREGVYPVDVLKPESPLEHFQRIPRVLGDAMQIAMRRVRGRTTEFKGESQDYLEDLPRYYRRNFHFQSDGYLSEASAELYEHQVEILFSGTADAMRRMIIGPMRAHFGSEDGQGLRFLEIGAGTGRATRFVRMAFPKAKIVAMDLSDPYLKVAQRKLQRFPRIDFLQGNGAELPFGSESFDAVYSIFLFHELPLEERKKVLAESQRVLRPGGFFGFVDSVQRGDNPTFEHLLAQFPQDFHEPFYRNYIENPMERLVSEAGFSAPTTDTGFLSKVLSSAKPK